MKNNLFCLATSVSAAMILFSVSCSRMEKEPVPVEDEIPDLTLDLTIRDVYENSAVAYVETSHDESTYYISAISKEDYNLLQTDEALIEDDKEFFKYLARKEGKSYQQVVDFMLNTGSKEEKFVNLTSDTEYIAYAYEMNSKGEVTGNIVKTEFRTEKQAGDPITFEMRMDSYRDNYAAVYVTPSTDTVWYVTGFVPESALAQYGGSMQAIKLYAMEYLLQNAEMGDLEIENIINIFCSKGDILFEDDRLIPETSYYAYAIAVDKYGKPISEASVLKFKTPQEGMIGFTIDIEVNDHIGSSVKAKIKTSDGKNTYFCNKYPSDLVESFSNDEELQNWILEDMGYSISYLLVNGSKEKTFADMLPDSDYYIIAFGYSGETESPTTPIFKKKFTTPVPESSNFEINVEMIKMGTMITVFPSDDFTPYAFGLIDKEKYDAFNGNMEDYFKNAVEQYQKNNPDLTKEQAVMSFAESGQKFITRQYLYSDRDYYFWTANVNRDCEFIGEAEIKEFRSKTHTMNDDYVTAEYSFYDAEEITKNSFLYREYEKYAVLHVEVTPSSDDVSYVPWVYSGNLESDTEYPDDIIRYDLINYKSALISRQIIYIVPWDTEFTLCIATVNDKLECGKVYRKCLTLRKDEAEPAENFKHAFDYPTFPDMEFNSETTPIKAETDGLHAAAKHTMREKASGKNCTETSYAKTTESEIIRFSKKMIKERLF